MGELCPYQDFYGGRPIKRKAKEVEEIVAEEEEEDSEDAEDHGAPDDGYLFSFTFTIFYLLFTFIHFFYLSC